MTRAFDVIMQAPVLKRFMWPNEDANATLRRMTRTFGFASSGEQVMIAAAISLLPLGWLERILKFREAEGVKRAGELTHIFRASAFTQMLIESMDETRAKNLIGHAVVGGGVSELYLKRLQLLRGMKSRDRKHLARLISPEDARRQAEILVADLRARGETSALKPGREA